MVDGKINHSVSDHPLCSLLLKNNRHLIHNEMCLSGGVLEVISWHWGR